MTARPPTFVEWFAGIGGFRLALEAAGFRCAWTCEIDPFCSSVQEARYGARPDAPDVRAVRAEDVPDADVWCGGWPCQGLSVAGLRKGLADERSDLFWQLVRLLELKRPPWICLENVPGLLTTCSCPSCGRRCKRCLAPAGADDESCELCGSEDLGGKVLPDHRGTDFFVVLSALQGLGYGVQTRVLDAQHFGVPQRRRRVFIVGRLGAPCPPEVLLEPEGGGGDPAPGREARAGAAAGAQGGAREPGVLTNDCKGSTPDKPCLTGSDTGSGRIHMALPLDNEVQAGRLIPTHEVSPCLQEREVKSKDSSATRPMVMGTLREHVREGSNTDYLAFNPTGGGSRGVSAGKISPTLKVGSGLGIPSGPAVVEGVNMQGGKGAAAAFKDKFPTLGADEQVHAIAAPLTANYGRQPDNSDRKDGTPNLVLLQDAAGYRDKMQGGIGIQPDPKVCYTLGARDRHGVAHALTAEGHDASEDGTGRGTPLVFDTTQVTHGENRSNPKPGGPCHPLAAGAHPPAMAMNLRGREEGARPELADKASLRSADGGSSRSYAVLPMTVQSLQPMSRNDKLPPDVDAAQANPSTELPLVPEEAGTQEDAERRPGVPDPLQPKEILRQEVHGEGVRREAEPVGGLVNDALPRQEARPKRSMRQMRETEREGCPPQGRKPPQQRPVQFGEDLPQLPLQAPQSDPLLFDPGMPGSAQGIGILREALPARQEMGASAGLEAEPAYSGDKKDGLRRPSMGVGGMTVRRLTPT